MGVVPTHFEGKDMTANYFSLRVIVALLFCCAASNIVIAQSTVTCSVSSSFNCNASNLSGIGNVSVRVRATTGYQNVVEQRYTQCPKTVTFKWKPIIPNYELMLTACRTGATDQRSGFARTEGFTVKKSGTLAVVAQIRFDETYLALPRLAWPIPFLTYDAGDGEKAWAWCNNSNVTCSATNCIVSSTTQQQSCPGTVTPMGSGTQAVCEYSC